MTSRRDLASGDHALVWLTSHHEGHLGYTTGHGRRRLAVRYAVCGDDRLVFRLPAYSSAMGYAPDQPVTMEVPVHDEHGHSEGLLLLTGTAVVVSGTDRGVADAVLDEHWPAGVTTRVLALSTTTAEHVRADRPTA